MLKERDRAPSATPRHFVAFSVGTTAESNRVNAMAFAPDGALWCATDGGLFRSQAAPFDTPSFEIVIPHKPVTETMAALADRRGCLWFTMWGGAVQIVGDHREVYLPRGPSDWHELHALAAGPGGRLLAAGGREIVEFVPPDGRTNRGRWERVPVSLDARHVVNAVAVDAAGGLWLGTSGGLVSYRRNSQALFTTADGLTHNDISTLFFDRDGNLWIGTYGGGTCEVSRERVLSFSHTTGFPTQTVHQVVEDHMGRILRGHGRQRPPRGRRRPGRQRSHAGAGPLALGAQRPARRQPAPMVDWHRPRSVSRRGGDPCLPRPERISCPLMARLPQGWRRCTRGPDHRMWVGFWDGRLYAADAGNDAVRFAPVDLGAGWPGGKVPSRLLTDRTGALWLGDQGAFARFSGGITRRFDIEEGLPETNPRALFEDSRGWLWIGLRYGGLSMTKSPASDRPRFESYSASNGLSSDTVWCVAEGRDGLIYIGTGNGLDRLDPMTGQIQRFSPADSLAGGLVTACRADRRGNIWLATTAGLSRFDPGTTPLPARRPPVFITRLQVGGVDTPLPETGLRDIPRFRVPQPDDGVLIEYVGLGVGAGRALRYRHQLSGAGMAWSEPTEQRSVYYAHLAPGRYRFLVRAVDQEGGLESEAPATVAFDVPRPWWTQWWFLLAAGACFATAVHTVYRARLRRVVALERIRTRLATDLHDDLGSDLSTIAMASEMALARVPAGEPQLGEWLSMIARTSRGLVDSMRDIVWAVNPTHDRLQDLVNRMRQSANDAVIASSVAFRFDAPEADASPSLDPDVRREVFLVFKEAVHNAARHSGCTEIEASLSLERGRLVLTVKDNGQGFDARRALEGHGLASMRRRAAGLGGTLEVSTAPGQGVVVTAEVPLSRPGASRRRWGR